jgi:hypothetical protein
MFVTILDDDNLPSFDATEPHLIVLRVFCMRICEWMFGSLEVVKFSATESLMVPTHHGTFYLK